MLKNFGIEKKFEFEVVNFLEFAPIRKFDYSIMIGFVEYFKNPELIMGKAIDITNRIILVSFPVAGGSLAFQRKLRYERRCFLRLYSYKDIKRLLERLNISSFTIEKIQRDFFVTINLN